MVSNSLLCHVERSRDISNYSPRISGARSFQRGLRVAINATFFCSRPFLELLFPCNGVSHICAVLVVDQLATAVIGGETWYLSEARCSVILRAKSFVMPT